MVACWQVCRWNCASFIAVKDAPTTRLERTLLRKGSSIVIGLDEVGKGAWAGPLMIGAAVLSRDVIASDDASELMGGARDSKQLSEIRREEMFDHVAETCAAWSIGFVTHAECDALGMNAAQRLATKRAIESLAKQIDVSEAIAVVDGRWDFVSPHICNVITQVKADASVLSVSAASVLAKVSRDRMMREYANDYSLWSFETNKGYPCPKHRTALQGYGPSALHRTSWAFMENFVPWLGRSTHQPLEPQSQLEFRSA
jgi:ribonuclease HII